MMPSQEMYSICWVDFSYRMLFISYSLRPDQCPRRLSSSTQRRTTSTFTSRLARVERATRRRTSLTSTESPPAPLHDVGIMPLLSCRCTNHPVAPCGHVQYTPHKRKDHEASRITSSFSECSTTRSISAVTHNDGIMHHAAKFVRCA